MARLVNPATGTVVHCEGDLAERYRATGWADADAQAQKQEAAPVKPQTKQGRPRKTK